MRCLECGAEIAERAQVCAQCGSWAPVEYQLYVAEDPADRAYDAAGGLVSAAIDASVGRQRPESAPGPEVDGAVLAEWAESRLAAQVGARREGPAAGPESGAAEAAKAVQIRCVKCGTETAEATQVCARCGAPAAPLPFMAADPAVGQQAEDARLAPREQPHQETSEDSRQQAKDPHRENALTAGGSQATSPPPSHPPIRRGMAVAGAWIALIAGVAELIWQLLTYTTGEPGVYLFALVACLVPIAVAVAALRRINRLVVLGLLQGMWWPAVAWVIEDVVSSSVDHAFGLTGRFLAGYWVGVTSDVLGACAAILLAVSWSPAVAWRRAPRLRPLPVLLLCGVGVSQIVIPIFTFTEQYTNAAFETLGIAGLPVGLAVTWYAVNLRDNALGGALVLGWSTIMALWLMATMIPWTAIGVLGCVLLAVVAVFALIYMRGLKTAGFQPSDL